MARLVDPHARAISSMTTAWVTLSAPMPPYSTGMPIPGELHLPARLEPVPRERRVAVDLGGVRSDPFLGHGAQCRAELLLVPGQGERPG